MGNCLRWQTGQAPDRTPEPAKGTVSFSWIFHTFPVLSPLYNPWTELSIPRFFVLLIPGKKPVQGGPGYAQLPRQSRLADFSPLVTVIVPGQVRDGDGLSALVSSLPLGNGDALPLTLQEICPLKLVDCGDYSNNCLLYTSDAADDR